MGKIKIAIFGSGGLLGKHLSSFCDEYMYTYKSWNRNECDISSKESVRLAIDEFKPNIIINAAAATDVDKCEVDNGYAYMTNSFGPMYLAEAANRVGAKIIHFSTDYVFPGSKPSDTSYHEEDNVEPISVYGKSKLLGEKLLAKNANNYLIVRVAWLFGIGGKNFISKIPVILKKDKRITAICNQWSSPTYVNDIIYWIFKNYGLKNGTYHVVNSGSYSYYDAASIAAQILEIPLSSIIKVDRNQLNQHAKRPINSTLSSCLVSNLRPFGEAYKDYIVRLAYVCERGIEARLQQKHKGIHNEKVQHID